jgi:putative transposase
VLDAENYAAWLDRFPYSSTTRALIGDIRQSEPVRRVEGRYGNMRGKYPSRKMGKTIQFESHQIELWAVYAMEHDPQVLEFYDQPNRIKIQYRGPTGRRVTNWHPPDFFVLRPDGAFWEEWKPEATLALLVDKHPSRYERLPSGGYRCPPGEAYAATLGLTYRVRSSAELPKNYIQNLMFLEDYWIAPLAVPTHISEPIMTAVHDEPGIRLSTLLQLTPDARPNVIYALIAQERLFFDWTAAPLGDHAAIRLYPDALSVPMSLVRTSISSDSLLQAALYWDGRAYLVQAHDEQGVQLQAEFGAPMHLPQDFFSHLLQVGAIRLLTSSDPQPVHSEVNQLLSRARPEALAMAQERMLAVQSYLYDYPPGYQQIAPRTLRRWVADFHVAEAQYNLGYVGLLPHHADRGNRTPRADATARQLMDEVITQRYTDPRRRTVADVYLTYQSACATKGVSPLSQRTFYTRVKAMMTPELQAQRLGTRAAYQESPPYWTLDPTTPRHGDRPFAIAHLDHTPLDIEIISQTGKLLGRPWATFMTDAYSRRLLAVYLTFDPPSYRSCMMALRICVRQHRRFPQALVVDGGHEFESRYFDQLLARYLCVKKVRPSTRGRFGSVLERLFGTTNTQLLSRLAGNTQATKTPRQLTPEINPRRHAVWTLAALSDVLCEWAYEVYDQTDHPAWGQPPREIFFQGLAHTGERLQRLIAYDDLFIKATMPTTDKGVVTIQPGKGVQLFSHYYWNDVFAAPSLAKAVVPIRYDPFDLGSVYVFVEKQWVACQSSYYAQFQGRSERELQVVMAEWRQQLRADPQRQRLTAERLVAFWERVEQQETILLQRIKDQESRPVREQIEGTASGSMTTPMLLPNAEQREHAPPIDLDQLILYDEYK